MKTNFTFDELSKIFAAVAKIENAAKKQQETEQAYEAKSAIFDAEFAKYGYTFFNAPAELQVMFDEKCALMDEHEKAERKAYKAIKDFAALLEIGNGSTWTEWVEDEIKEYIKGKRYYKIAAVADHCKYLAANAARKITY